MSDLVSDTGVAADLAAALTDLDMSGATPIPTPGQTNISGTLAGVSLGNGLRFVFEELNGLIDTKAENLVEIANLMAQRDAMIARWVS